MQGFDKRQWHKSWSSWSGSKSSECSLHLDDILDSSKSPSQISEVSEGGQHERVSVSHNQSYHQNTTSVRNGPSGDFCRTNPNLKIQGHVSRLLEYSELCERANAHNPDSEPPMSPLGWILRFKSREMDTTDLSQGASFLSSSSGCGSPLLKPQIRPAQAPHDRSRKPQRRHSFPINPVGPPAVPKLHSEASPGDQDETAVYRQQVASALESGRTVWL